MVNCPKCGRPVGGSARTCGYCGESLIADYFTKEKSKTLYPKPGAGSVAATVLGTFGAVAALAALMLQILVLFGFGGDGAVIPDLDTAWWVRTLLMSIAPSIFLVQQLLLRGLRFSLIFDGFWLFLSSCGLCFTAMSFWERQAADFYGVPAIAYLLTVGCALACISCITGILSYKRPAYPNL